MDHYNINSIAQEASRALQEANLRMERAEVLLCLLKSLSEPEKLSFTIPFDDAITLLEIAISILGERIELSSIVSQQVLSELFTPLPSI